MIRKAEAEDIPTLFSLQKEIETEQAIWGYGADPAEEWSKRNLAWTFLAMDGTRPLGFIYGCERPYAGECIFPSASRILEIVELVVTAKERAHGIGHELVTVLEKRALEEGITHLRIYSAAKRFDAIVRFYRSCGFAPWYVEMTKRMEE